MSNNPSNRVSVLTNLSVCDDCAMLCANDEHTSERHTLAYVTALSAIGAAFGARQVTLVIEEHTDDFTIYPCSVCQTRLAGSRWSASLLG